MRTPAQEWPGITVLVFYPFEMEKETGMVMVTAGGYVWLLPIRKPLNPCDPENYRFHPRSLGYTLLLERKA